MTGMARDEGESLRSKAADRGVPALGCLALEGFPGPGAALPDNAKVFLIECSAAEFGEFIAIRREAGTRYIEKCHAVLLRQSSRLIRDFAVILDHLLRKRLDLGISGLRRSELRELDLAQAALKRLEQERDIGRSQHPARTGVDVIDGMILPARGQMHNEQTKATEVAQSRH
jgi:hypothetical protein